MPLGPNVGQNLEELTLANKTKVPAKQRPPKQIQAIAIDAAKRKTGVGQAKPKKSVPKAGKTG